MFTCVLSEATAKASLFLLSIKTYCSSQDIKSDPENLTIPKRSWTSKTLQHGLEIFLLFIPTCHTGLHEFNLHHCVFPLKHTNRETLCWKCIWPSCIGQVATYQHTEQIKKRNKEVSKLIFLSNAVFSYWCTFVPRGILASVCFCFDL